MHHTHTDQPLIVVAEPSTTSAASIRRQLEWAGYEVLGALDGEDALARIDEWRPAGAVIEVMMPGLNGYQVVRQLRADGRHRLMPVIMMSTRAGKLDRDFAFTVGADDYFKKPFRCSELVARLSQLVPTGPATAPVSAARMPVRAGRGAEQEAALVAS